MNISVGKGNRSNRTVAFAGVTALAFSFFSGGFASLAHADESQLLVATIIRGADTYSTLQLLPTYQKHLGQPITNPAIEAIAADINKLYAKDGYTQPEMRLDNSQLGSGVLGIDVFEAQISKVVVTGNQGPYVDELSSARRELLALKPLRVRDLQTILRRIRELPGLTANVTTKKDPEHAGGYELDLQAAFKKFDSQIRLTNRGTEEVGRDFLIAQSAANGLFGRDLKAGAVVGLAESIREFRGAGIFVDSPIVNSTRATLLAFRSLSNPTETPDFNIDYPHNRIALTFTDPWRRLGDVEYKGSGTLELDDLYIDLDGARLQADCERVASVSTQLLWNGDGATQYLTVLGIRRGFDAFGARIDSLIPIENDRGAAFTVATAQLIRVSRFKSLWQLRLDMLGQFSNDVLADRERFKIGGDHLGRGFEVPAITGDRGVGGKVELRRDVPQLNTSIGNFSTYGYYDLGAAWRNPSSDHQSAASAAIGVAIQGKKLTASLELARPLTHADVDGNRRNTLFVEIIATF